MEAPVDAARRGRGAGVAVGGAPPVGRGRPRPRSSGRRAAAALVTAAPQRGGGDGCQRAVAARKLRRAGGHLGEGVGRARRGAADQGDQWRPPAGPAGAASPATTASSRPTWTESFRPAGQLGGAEDGRVEPDAAGVEELLRRARSPGVTPWKRSSPWVKKGRFSGKKSSKVERFCWMWSASTCPKSGLTVACSASAAAQAGAQVEPEVGGRVEHPRGGGGRRRRSAGATASAAGEVRRHRELLHRLQAVEAGQVGHPGDDAAVARLRGMLTELLVGAGDDPLHHEAPGLVAVGREAQDRERDEELGGPAAVGGGDGAVPDRVPVAARLVLAEEERVGLHPGGVELEVVGGPPVPVGVEQHRHHVGVRGAVATAEGASDSRPAVAADTPT